jgi:hypothetical protein
MTPSSIDTPGRCRQPELSQRLTAVSEATIGAHPLINADPIDQPEQHTARGA